MGPSADTHTLNARLLRFRSRPEQEDPFALAEDLIAAQRYGDARGVLVSAQTDDGQQQGRLLVLEGRAWYMDRDLAQAQAALLKAAKLDPQHADAFRWLGEVLLKRGDPARASRAFGRAQMLGAQDPELPRLLERASQLARHAPEVSQDAEPAPAKTQRASPRVEAEPLAAAPVRAPSPVAPRPPVVAPRPPIVAPRPLAVAPPPATRAPEPAPAAAPHAKPRAAQPVFSATRQGAPSPFPPAPAAVLAPPPAAAASFVDLSEGALDRAAELSAPGTLASPAATSGTQSSSGQLSSPGVASSPGRLSSPGTQSSPGRLPSPSAASSPGRLSSPTASSSRASSPGTRSSPGAQSSPGVVSSPGALSSPGRLSSPGSAAPPSRTSSSGATSSPGTRSSPGRVSSPGVASSPGLVTASPAIATGAFELDVDVDFEDGDPAPAASSSLGNASFAVPPTKVDTTPGLGDAPIALRTDPTPISPWQAASVAIPWPVQEPLLEREPIEEPSDDDELGPDPEIAPSLTPDLALGEQASEADDPAALLEMLRDHGIFEPPEAGSPAWTASHEVPNTGARLRGALIFAWVSVLVLSGVGYGGWQLWVAHRHAVAAQLVAEAKADSFEGDYSKLVDAERLLRLARDKHPRSLEVPRLELFVHSQRLLEGGSRDLSALRAAQLRAERLHADPAYVAAARAVLAVYSGMGRDTDGSLARAVELMKGEPELLYIVGRLQQRLGQADASARLQAAAAAAPDLVAAALALAELQEEQGHEPEALAGFSAILARRPGQLRAQLWRAFLTADALDPVQGMSALEAVAKHARAGAPIDRILWALARSRLLRRKGELVQAGDAVKDGLLAGASEPRLLALIAGEARRAGQLGVAQQAASQAVAAAPAVLTYRALLARILIERHDGEAAWSLLSALPADEPALFVMRARAALQMGETQALRAALAALEPQTGSARAGVEVASLRLRLRAALEPSSKVLQDAKVLLHRAPGDPDALRAMGEAALGLRDPQAALSAFDQLVAMTPDDAEAHHLLARARRLAVDAKGAEASLRRALALSPGYAPALVTLGGLLLDTGKYAEADAVYQELATRSVHDGRLGRAEALLGLGRIDDAQAQITGLPEAQRDDAQARETAGRVALARRKPGEALELLRPLLEGDRRRASALALYGDALYAAGQVNPAAGAYDSALELDAQLPEALLGRGEVHIRAERFAEAIELLEKAKTALETRLRAPELRARMQTLLGRAHVLRGKKNDLEAARDLLRQAIKEPHAPADAFFWLGEALGGRITPESAAAFKRYLELEPDGDYAARAKRALGPLL